MGVLLLHQAAPPRERTKPRGILAAFADILIDMRVPGGDPHTRRRDFDCVGRFPGMLGHVAAELNPEGTDYLLLSVAPEAALAPALDKLRQVLRESPQPLTRQEILDRWPTPTPPAGNTLWRALASGCAQGVLVRTGAGTKAEAFRYGVKRDQ